MTTVQITFRYKGDFDPEALPRTQEDHGNYGIRQIRVDSERRFVTVEYDATRLKEPQVAAVLRRVGVPVVEQVPASTLA